MCTVLSAWDTAENKNRQESLPLERGCSNQESQARNNSNNMGISLVVQWLRLCLPTQEGWGTKIPRALWPKKTQNPKQKFSGEEICRHSGWKGWERVHGNIYIIICKMDSQWEFAVWLMDLKPGLCDNLGGGMGWEVQEGGDICITMSDLCWYITETNKQYYKAIIFQLKIN